MAYDYTNGDGVAVLLVTEPNGATEPLSNLDNAIRQIKAYLNDPTEGPAARIDALASPIRVIATHGGSQQPDESDGEVTVEFDTIDLDSGGDFNNATYLFTAPEDGLYLFICQVALAKIGGTGGTDIVHQLSLYVDGVRGAQQLLPRGTDDSADVHLLLVRLFNLSAGQTVSARFSVTVSAGTLQLELQTNPYSTIFQVTRFALS